MSNTYKVFLCLLMLSTLSGEGLVNKKFLKIGHRGACGYEPENTLQSFEKAIALGVDAIEFDVQQCATGELIVIHDKLLHVTTNGFGYVKEKKISELTTLSVKGKGKLAKLEDVLDLVNRRVPVNIEIKDPDVVNNLACIINNYVKHKGWSYKDFFISSFDHCCLLKFFNKCNQVYKGAAIGSVPHDLASFAEKMKLDFISASANSITQAFVDDAHKRGIKVFVFTVNDACEVERMKKLSVDGIFTDYPDRLH